MRFSVQHGVLVLAVVLLVSSCLADASRGRKLLASESPVNSDTINSILSKGVKIITFGQNTEVPPPILQGATDLASFSTPFQPSNAHNTQASTILFQCRAVGNQIYTVSECAASSGQLDVTCLSLHMMSLFAAARLQLFCQVVSSAVTSACLQT